MNYLSPRLSASVAAIGACTFGLVSRAFAVFGDDNVVITDLPGTADPTAVIINVIEAVLGLLALVAVIVIIIAGIRLIVSGGEDEQKDKAKKMIFYALIGLIIVLLANVIVRFVTSYIAGNIGG